MIHLLEPGLIGQTLQIDVAGAGGNGSQIVTGLARMHLALQAVGHPGLHIDLFDPDLITEANVGRQLFSPSDVGESKAAVLINRLNCYYGLDWSAHPKLYSNGSYTGSCHFLIGCVDSIAARRELKRAPAAYWLDLGNRDRTGQVILGQPKGKWNAGDATRPRTVMEMFPELNRGNAKEDDAPSCSLAAALERQDLYINQTVATFALQLLWSFIRNGQTAINGYFINLESGRVVPIPIIELTVVQPKSKPKGPEGKPLAEIFAAHTPGITPPPLPRPLPRPRFEDDEVEVSPGAAAQAEVNRRVHEAQALMTRAGVHRPPASRPPRPRLSRRSPTKAGPRKSAQPAPNKQRKRK